MKALCNEKKPEYRSDKIRHNATVLSVQVKDTIGRIVDRQKGTTVQASRIKSNRHFIRTECLYVQNDGFVCNPIISITSTTATFLGPSMKYPITPGLILAQ